MKKRNNLKKRIVKTSILIFLILPFIFCSCKKEESPADENLPQIDMGLIGTWHITKMTSIFQGSTEVFTESQLDSLGIVWEYKFENDLSVELTTNIDGPLVIMPGTWSTSDNQLTMILAGPSGTPGTLVFEYLIEGNILKLDWNANDTNYLAEFTKQ